MRASNFKKIPLGLMCLIALGTVAGCGNKDDAQKTPQQAKDFAGHPPTPAELQAAMSKMSQHATGPGQPGAGQPPAPK